jgi:hypothetical protein
MKNTSPASSSISMSKNVSQAEWEKAPEKWFEVGETDAKQLANPYKSGRKVLFLLESQSE